MIKLLTFDLDNTLWHVDEVIARATKIKFQWLNDNYPIINEKVSTQRFLEIRNQLIKENPAIIADLSLLRILTVEHAALEAGISTTEAKILARKAFDIFFEQRNKVELFPDTHNVLETLAKDYQLIALTNGNADLKVIGINHYFSAHYKPIDAGAPKPEPAMFQLAMQTAKTKPEQSVHIGDDLVCDIQGANALGMLTIFSNTLRKNSPESEALANASIHYLRELPATIQALS